MEKFELESLVAKAQSGDGDATEKLLLEIKDQVYRLSLRMLFFASRCRRCNTRNSHQGF